MDLSEMIDGVLAKGGNGRSVVRELIKYGHLPPDANTRPAGMTAKQCALIDDLARTMLASEKP